MPVQTYRLETFGKLALIGGASAGVSHQRRRLALLALLAASGERGLSRDQLLGYLWPDTSSANARHSLEQLIHGMRRSLGESIFSGVNPVRLNPEVIASDVAEFESALAREALAEAVAVYHGPFLHGFYLEDAPEFERWFTAECTRLAQRYSDALDRLAGEAESAGDHMAAVRWRRRAVEADPVSSRLALGLMRALVASGDRTAALQHFRVYEALVQQELESGPDPSIVAYAASLRTSGEIASSTAPSSKVSAGANQQMERVASPTASIPESISPMPTPQVSQTPDLPAQSKPLVSARYVTDEAKSRRARYWLIAGIPVAAVILLIAALSTARREMAPMLDQYRIVVVPFRTSGVDSSVKYLGEGIVDLIAPMLTGEGGPIAVDSRTAISTWNRITLGRDGTADDARRVARELGAGLVLTGAAVELGGTLTITGNLISGDDGHVQPLNSVAGPSDSVHTLLNRFVAQLLARQSGVAETSVAAIASQSLPAIRAYLNGRAAYRRADEKRAIESFTRALEIDSTFALAALDLAVATGRIMRARICRMNACRVFSIAPAFASSEVADDLFDRAVRLAWEHRVKLGKRDRPLLDALRGDNYPDESSARLTLLSLRRAIAAAPDRPETHYLLGVLLLYQGPALGVGDSRAAAEAEFREALKLDPSYLAPLARMVDVAAFARDTMQLRRAGALYLGRDSVGPTPDYVRWLLAAAGGDVSTQRRIRALLRSYERTTLEQIYVTSQMSGIAIEDADSATIIIADNATDPLDRSIAFRRGQLLALNRGRPTAATAYLRQVDILRSPTNTFGQFAIAYALFNDGDRSVADSSARYLSKRLARDTLQALSPDMERRVSTAMAVLSLWYLYSGDTTRWRAAMGWLRRHAAGQPRNPVLSILPEMLVVSRSRRADGAVLRARVDSILLDGCCEFPEFVPFVLAKAYEESGDEAAALRVIRRGAWYSPPRMLSTWVREEGRLAARLGDRASAIRAYEHYLALRSDPEPALRAERDRIRAEVKRLKGAR